jgi:hypothetical protein
VKVSTRNQLRGTVVSVTKGEAMAVVKSNWPEVRQSRRRSPLKRLLILNWLREAW